MVGTTNDIDAVLKTKVKRDINRRTLTEAELLAGLNDPCSKLSHITNQLGRLLELRVRHRAFHPNGIEKILTPHKQVFAALRVSPEGDEHILTLTNVGNSVCWVQVALADLGIGEAQWYDLYGRRGWMARDKMLGVTLQPHDVVWLIPFVELERRIES